MSIAEQTNALLTDLRACRTAILNKGGTISATAGFEAVAEQIASIPSGGNIGTFIDDSTALIKTVPENSVSYCYLNYIGGMTYKCNNLIPFPYRQETTTINGVTFTVNDDHSITVDGTATASATFYLLPPGFNLVTGGKTYTMSVGNIPDNSSTSTYFMSLQVFDANGGYLQGANFTGMANKATFVGNNNAARTTIYIYVSAGTTVNNATFYPMFTEGSTALPYEPYYTGLRDTKVTALKVNGANLIPFPYRQGTTTINGVTFTVNNDNSITVNGTATAGASFNLLKKGTHICTTSDTYTFSAGNIPADSSNSTYYMSLQLYKESTYIGGINLNGKLPSSSFVGKAEATSTTIYIYVTAGTTVNNVVFKPMLSYGSTAVPYKPYHEPITYPLPEEILALTDGKGVEGYASTVDFERGKIVKKCETVVLDGVNVKTHYVDKMGDIYFAQVSLPTPSAKTTSVICSHYKTNANPSIGVCYVAGTALKSFIFYPLEQTLNTIALVNSWLQEQYANGNPVTVTFALADSTETDLPVGFSPLVPVEGGGTIEIITDTGYAIPTTITYQIIGG